MGSSMTSAASTPTFYTHTKDIHMTAIRTRLTHETLFVLQKWLNDNKDILTQHTFRDLATKASVDLGIPVSYSSVDRVSKLLKLPAGLPSTQTRKTTTVTDQQMTQLQTDSLAIARIMQSLLHQLSGKESPVLGEIITRLKAAK
jgi:hypothetical protein